METKEINGTLYGCEKLPATKGLALQLKVGKFIGGSIGNLQNIDGENIASIIGGFVSNVDDEEFAKFVKDTVITAYIMEDVEGEQVKRSIPFDKHFEDDYMSMWEVFAFVLEVNLGKFISAVKSRFAPAKSTKRAPKK